MKILWIPHVPVGAEGWDGSRQYHLIRNLGESNEIHCVSWRQTRRLSSLPRLGRRSTRAVPSATVHDIELAPNIYRLWTRAYPRQAYLLLNQLLFRRAIRRLSREVGADVAVYSASHHWTGFPPFDIEAPVVFDYVDHSPRWVEERYVKAADATITVSERLEGLVREYGKVGTTIVNGVDLARYTNLDRTSAKQRLDLHGKDVISLIGLTCCPSLYFLEAIAALQRQRPQLALLIVGGGAMREKIVQRARELNISNLIAPGGIANSEIHWYFAATDVGLYPGQDTSYYRYASPLKIVEYTAVGAQVVSSPVEMFKDGWPNVRLVEPTAARFEHAIEASLVRPAAVPAVESYDWKKLAQKFEQVLKQTVEVL